MPFVGRGNVVFLGDVEEELGEFGVVFAVAVVVVEVGEGFDVVVPGLRGRGTSICGNG